MFENSSDGKGGPFFVILIFNKFVQVNHFDQLKISSDRQVYLCNYLIFASSFVVQKA